MKKYEVTDIPHPYYPWLHRIRALYSFRSDVQKGQLGGYVQSEDNLSQEGTCWLFDDAVAIEDAFVMQQAVMKNKAIAKGHCLVSGTAVCDGNALVCDDAIVTAGNLTDCCLVGGTANIHAHPQTGISPKLCDHAKVYGELSGQVKCRREGVVLPGTVLNNPTFDTFSISDLGVQVSVCWNHASRNILPPTYEQQIHAGRGNLKMSQNKHPVSANAQEAENGKEKFEHDMEVLLGMRADKLIAGWEDWVKECLDNEQYVDFVERPRSIAEKQWYEELLYCFKRVNDVYGKAVLEKVVAFADVPHTLYPWEIMPAAQIISSGGTPQDVIKQCIGDGLPDDMEYSEHSRHCKEIEIDPSDLAKNKSAPHEQRQAQLPKKQSPNRGDAR